MHYKHGRSPRWLYNRWQCIKARCLRPSHIGYARYGGRGITICEEWLNWPSFRDWSLDNGAIQELEIDRINNDGNYCPENCRWTTSVVNQRNRSDNRLFTINGVTKCLAEWCEEFNIDRWVVKGRIERGADIQVALTTAVQKQNRGKSMELYTLKGVTKTFRDWCKQYEKALDVVHKRLESGWNFEQALTEPLRTTQISQITMNGETHTVFGWSKVLGTNYQTVCGRIRNGWSIEDALTIPIGEKRK